MTNKNYLYAYRQLIEQNGVEKSFISFSTSYPALKDAECLGRIALESFEVTIPIKED